MNRDAISVASHISQRWDPSNIPKASPKWSNFCIDIRFEVLTNKTKEHSGIQKVSKKNPAEISIHPGWWMTSIARTSYKSCLSRCRNDIRWVMVMTLKWTQTMWEFHDRKIGDCWCQNTAQQKCPNASYVLYRRVTFGWTFVSCENSEELENLYLYMS